MDYDFEWDEAKARSNLKKHGVAFEQAAKVFEDPFAISVFDEAHSADEERWYTLGMSASVGLLVVHHTFRGVERSARVRVISSRKASRAEASQYRRKP